MIRTTYIVSLARMRTYLIKLERKNTKIKTNKQGNKTKIQESTK